MNMIYISLLIIPLLYSLISFIELFSMHSRASGFFLNKNAIGYSLQNATFTVTRFFYILMMPLVGFVIDQRIGQSSYTLMVISSFLGASLMSMMVILLTNRCVLFYNRVICLYCENSSLIKSVIMSLFERGPSLYKNKQVVLECKYIKNIDKNFFLLSIVIYTLHASGIFLTFYFALSHHENRVMISQLSGIVNALGTLLLTFKLDPALAIAIENNVNFVQKFASVILARFLVYLFFAPLFFLIITSIF